MAEPTVTAMRKKSRKDLISQYYAYPAGTSTVDPEAAATDKAVMVQVSQTVQLQGMGYRSSFILPCLTI